VTGKKPETLENRSGRFEENLGRESRKEWEKGRSEIRFISMGGPQSGKNLSKVWRDTRISGENAGAASPPTPRGREGKNPHRCTKEGFLKNIRAGEWACLHWVVGGTNSQKLIGD